MPEVKVRSEEQDREDRLYATCLVNVVTGLLSGGTGHHDERLLIGKADKIVTLMLVAIRDRREER